ncbi:MFS transporter [Herbaspirillum sp. RV1423]|uniref:MFS transporter n=1 Tax=Herbaspirillum sp. RV1423 TaxID=1443993 RepID=UPI0004B4CA8F|nr:MFS transporter [Herbaspirillum sp. RV1423]
MTNARNHSSADSRIGLLRKYSPARQVVFSIAGNQLGLYFDLALAFSLIVYELNGTAFDAAFYSCSYALPVVLISPLAGALVDRQNNVRPYLIVASLCCTVFSFLQFLSHDLWTFLLLVVLKNSARIFVGPANMVILRNSVPEDVIPRILGIGQTIQHVSKVAAPAIAGALLSIFSARSLFALSTGCYLFACLAFCALKPASPTHRISHREKRRIIDDILAGLRGLTTSPKQRVVVTSMALVTLCYFVADSQLSIFLKYYGLEASDYGLMLAAAGAGGVTGGLVISSGKFSTRPTFLIISGAITEAIGFSGVASSSLFNAPLLLILLPAVFLIGLASTSTGTGFYVLIQKRTDISEIGRMTSLLSTLNGAVLFVGPMLGAYLFSNLSILAPYVFSILGLLAVAVIVGISEENSRFNAHPKNSKY